MEPGKWKKEWEKAKKDFTKVTKKKKPKSTIDAKASKKSGLAALLAKCDAEFINFSKQEGPKADRKKKIDALQAFRFNSKQFKSTGESYVKDIQAEMTKAKDKDLMNELDVLRKQIRAIADTMVAHGKVMESAVKGDKIVEATAKNLRSSLEGGLKRAALFLAQVKAKQDTKFWNDNLMKATRDVYQQIGNVEMLRKKGLNVKEIPTKNAPASLAQMKVWRTGKPAFAPGQEKEMMVERMKVLKACQDVITWLKSG